MTEKDIFRANSIRHLTYEAIKYSDILYVVHCFEQPYCLKIICKPNYDSDQVNHYIKNNLPLGIKYEIIVKK